MTGLPAEITFGKVVGRWILAVADTPTDPDKLPEAKVPTGTVKFTRKVANTSLLDTTQADGTYVGVARQSVTAQLDATGEIHLNDDPPGVWLVEGDYIVEPTIANITWPKFDITITAAHTEQSPLDLIAWTPAPVPPGATVLTMQVPSTVTDGFLLARSGNSVVGVDPATLGGGGAVPVASETVAGIVELATPAETAAGDDATRATTPAGVKAALDAKSVSDVSTYAALSHDHHDDYAPIAGGLFATERRTYTDRLLDLRRTAKVYNTIESFADVTGWSAGAAETIDGFTTLSIPTPWETIKDYNAPFAITATQINVVVRFHVVNVDRLSSLRLYFYDASGSNGYGGVLSAPPGGWVEGWNVGTTKRTTFSTIGVAPGWDALEQMRFKVYPVTSPSYPTVNVAEVSPYEMQPMCSIWFDDGHETVVTKAFPIMDAKGFTGSLTVQGQMDYYPGAHMTAQQHRDLAQAGWDLSNHTWSHPDLSVLDEAGNEAEISRGLDIALKLGGGAAAYHFVPPMGRTNAYTLAAASKYATVMRRNAGANIMPVADFMALKSVEPAVGELATTTISVINGAITAQTWLILLFHSIGDGDPTLSRNVGGFQAIIDHLDAHRAEITTLPPTLAIASM